MKRIQVSCKHFASLTSRTYRISKQNTDYCTGKKWKKTNWLGNLIVVRVRAVLYISLSRDQEYKKSPNKNALITLWKVTPTRPKAGENTTNSEQGKQASTYRRSRVWRLSQTPFRALTASFNPSFISLQRLYRLCPHLSRVLTATQSVLFPSFLRGRLLIGDNDSQFFCAFPAVYLLSMLSCSNVVRGFHVHTEAATLVRYCIAMMWFQNI